ncbi:MAG: YebC/PmpR family DNA-binding transcriptional regulator, partial [Planctomycetes bacterium]|nr:YebC/PmpR family DNA-binding transcriptional regulator [Planctomycetota bacterium]
FEKVRKALEARGLKPTSAELGMVPLSLVPLSQDVGRRILALMEELEDHEDVQNVYANFTLPPELLAEAQAAG